MGMTDAEKRAYRRGYNARVHGNWPSHKPPTPPTPIVRNLMLALRGLRDSVDAACATFEPDDPFVLELNAPIDTADKALEAVTTWLESSECIP